jgi:hypothetical protein
VASQFFYSSWENLNLAAWAAPTFASPTNMSLEIGQRNRSSLISYDEEEPAIWFHLIEAQFSVAGIKSQKPKYANALANLPKQVLWDILDRVNACNELDLPFDDLKIVLLGQFGKSKWQSYFELLRLPLDMQGLKPAFTWANSNSPFRMASALTMICSLLCSSFKCILPCEKR